MNTRAAPRAKPRPADPPRRQVDPRVRERWIAARRAEGRRRLRIVLSVATVLVFLVIAYAVVASPLLDIDHIVVTGTSHTTPSQVEAAGGLHRGDMMVWLDTGAASQQIAALPWIRDAHVERQWPGTVKVVVTERSAAGWVDTGSGPALVDGTGRLLERVSEPPTDLPQVVTEPRALPLGATITPNTGAEVAGKLEGYARTGTRTITVTPGGVVLGLVSGPDIRLGQPTRVSVKIRSAIAVLTALDGEAVQYIDVTVPSNPVAGPPP